MLLEVWEALLRIYSQTSRIGLIRQREMTKELRVAMLIYGLVSIFSFVLAVTFLSFMVFLFSALLITVTAWCINIYFEKKLSFSKKRTDKYFPRREYVRQERYERFVQAVRDEVPHVYEILPHLIAWNDSRVKVYQRMKPIVPVVIVVLGSALTMVASLNLLPNVVLGLFVVIVLVLFMITMVLDMVMEILSIKEYSIFEVGRFLRWMLLEQEVANKFDKAMSFSSQHT